MTVTSIDTFCPGVRPDLPLHAIAVGGDRDAEQPMARQAGGCTLVGAGPGDPELLTVKAIRAIRAATVILVDDLVDRAVLRWARRSARIIPVGKRGGCLSTPQAYIERLMVSEVLRGERVVRLKGGDPLIFGRAGEEIDALRRHGIEVEVVNGITSSLAAAAELGISLTHREQSQGVLMLTGHVRDHGTAIDWDKVAALAATGVTVILYMGVAQAPQIQSRLAQSLPLSIPLAVVERASQPGCRVVVATLADLASLVESGRVASPALVVIGDVVRGCRALHIDTVNRDDVAAAIPQRRAAR